MKPKQDKTKNSKNDKFVNDTFDELDYIIEKMLIE